MAKKKKTTTKKTGGFGGFFSKKKSRKSKNSPSFATGLKIALIILFLTVLVGGGAIGLIYLDDYVKTAAENEVPEGTVVFMKPTPIWMNQEWLDWIEEVLGGTTFPLNAHSAQVISDKLKQVAWVKNTRIQTQPDCIEVYAEYRRPVGLVGSKNNKVYVADDLAIMNYIPMTAIPVIEIKGVSSSRPEPGQTWFAEDAKAAVELLNWLYIMDLHFQQEKRENKDDETASPDKKIPEKPLLNEIESIDVSNFAGRKSSSREKPHIIFNAKDGTKIHWGAAWGQATDCVEAEEKEKLAGLYEYFVEHHDTLQGGAKIIELRWPNNSIPRPR